MIDTDMNSSNVNCPATDKEGTALTASSDDSADEFATCTYRGGAGECTYFFAVRFNSPLRFWY